MIRRPSAIHPNAREQYANFTELEKEKKEAQRQSVIALVHESAENILSQLEIGYTNDTVTQTRTSPERNKDFFEHRQLLLHLDTFAFLQRDKIQNEDPEDNSTLLDFPLLASNQAKVFSALGRYNQASFHSKTAKKIENELKEKAASFNTAYYQTLEGLQSLANDQTNPLQRLCPSREAYQALVSNDYQTYNTLTGFSVDDNFQGEVIRNILDAYVLVDSASEERAIKVNQDLVKAVETKINFQGLEDILFLQEALNTELAEGVLVSQKEPQTEPSPNLRYSIQVIAYNEMPNEQGTTDELPNLALQLRSIATAAKYYRERGGDVSEIEALYNINNPPEEKTLGNERAIALLQSIKNGQPTEDAVGSFDWVDGTNKKSQQFYTKLLEDLRVEVEHGLQIHAVDCTDGAYIATQIDALNKQIEHQSQPTRGSHRRLLGATASKRFQETQQHANVRPDEQFMIPADGEVFFAANFFQELAIATELDNASLIRTPYRFTNEPFNSANNREETAQNIQISFYLRDITKTLQYQFADTYRDQQWATGFTSIAGTYIYSLPAYEKTRGWDITRHVGEDSAMLENLRNLNGDKEIFIEQNISSVRDRIREGSSLGNIETRTGKKIRTKIRTEWIEVLNEISGDKTAPFGDEIERVQFPELLLFLMEREFGKRLNKEELNLIDQIRHSNPTKAKPETAFLASFILGLKEINAKRETYPHLAEFFNKVGTIIDRNDPKKPL